MEYPCISADCPQADGVFSDSQAYIKRPFSHPLAATLRKITSENTDKFYGLIPF